EPEPDPEPEPEPEPELQPTENVEPSAAAPSDLTPSDTTETADPTGNSSSSNNEAEQLQATGSNVVNENRYLSEIQSWLARHKRYPRRAKRQRLEGEAELFVHFSSQGEVLDYSVRTSSGHKILDDEVLEMVKRAQPFPSTDDPALPDEFRIVIPIRFTLSDG
ncbi:MAG: energy transducer TonB, partial [Pseudomonadota bacterium]